MPFGQALLHSYSLVCRDRGRASVARSPEPPRGLFAGSTRQSHRAHLPARPNIVPRRLSYGQTEKRGQRVMCRCMSLGRTASLFQAAGSLVGAIADDGSAATPILAKMALQGFASGMTAFDPFFLDMAAGLLGHTAHHGADRLQSYASEELEQQGGVLGGRERLLQLAAYCAFVDTPIMHTWQDFLDTVVIPSDPNGPLTVALKVVLDQGLMAPLATILMLLTLKLLEGGDAGQAIDHARQQLRERLLPDYTIWPLARVVQYSLVPSAAHPLFEGAVSVMSAAMQVMRHKKRKTEEQEAYAAATKANPPPSQPATDDPFARTSFHPTPAPSRAPPAPSAHHPTADYLLRHHPLAAPPRAMTPPPAHHSQSRLSRQTRSTDSSPFHRQVSDDAAGPSAYPATADQPLHLPNPLAAIPAKLKVWQGMRPVSPFAINSHVPLDALEPQGSLPGGDVGLSDKGTGSGSLHHSGQLHVRCSFA